MKCGSNIKAPTIIIYVEKLAPCSLILVDGNGKNKVYFINILQISLGDHSSSQNFLSQGPYQTNG